MYVEVETQTSFDYLEKVVNWLEEPVCLFGGWAIYLTVNKGFAARMQRNYLGSRDIDLGFFIDEKWSEDELRQSSFGRALKALEAEGFELQGFRYRKPFDLEGRELSRDAAKDLPLYNQFTLFVDPSVNRVHPKAREVFGFVPIDETLLDHVFAMPTARTELTAFKRKLWLPAPHILLATKLKSLPNRDKHDKRIKDACDIVALLLFSQEIKALVEGARRILSQQKIDEALQSMDPEDKRRAAELLNIPENEIDLNLARLQASLRKGLKPGGLKKGLKDGL